MLFINVKPMFALVDCNNFYASCERVFRPELNGLPIVVLSYNDGCIIARSQEAKDYKIPMGIPIHKARDLVDRYNIQVFSANFTLYGDMSRRVMKIIRSYIPQMEIYSIDEAFLSMDSKNISQNYAQYGLKMREDILKSTGIPVSIGIAPTKSLTKICNHYAKKHKETGGVFDWNDIKDKNEFLEKLPIEEVWGIGRKTSYKMQENSIYNGLQLKNANPVWLRKNFSVSELKIATELNEIPCLELEYQSKARKNIMSSRSFGRGVEKIEELEEAVATYISRGAEKLREQKSLASYIYVSIKTNLFRPDIPQYFNYIITPLNIPSNYNPDLIKTGLEGLQKIYKPGFKYKKATIMLLGLIPDEQGPLGLFFNDSEYKKKKNLMDKFDKLNNKFGREVIKYAASGIDQSWRAKHAHCSPQYTTDWNQLLKVF